VSVCTLQFELTEWQTSRKYRPFAACGSQQLYKWPSLFVGLMPPSSPPPQPGFIRLPPLRKALCFTTDVFLFNLPQDLRAPSADRHETSPRDCCLCALYNTSSMYVTKSVTLSRMSWFVVIYSQNIRVSAFLFGFTCVTHCLTTESQRSVAVTLFHVSVELHLVYGREVVYCLKFQITHNMTASSHLLVLAKWTQWASDISLAVNTLQL